MKGTKLRDSGGRMEDIYFCKAERVLTYKHDSSSVSALFLWEVERRDAAVGVSR